jgi:outer membrane cobalamin receptor
MVLMPSELPTEPGATVEAAPATPVTEPEATQAPSEISESAAASGDQAAAGEMVVTGSRIRRTSFAQPSAVAVVSRDELQKSGAQTFGDVVKYMTINTGSDINTGVSTNSGSTMSFNLRGLGVNSTLVLLNGRRVVQSGAASTDGDNFVDINTIPIAAIERIEVRGRRGEHHHAQELQWLRGATRRSKHRPVRPRRVGPLALGRRLE